MSAVILDCDPGLDDVMAILLAAKTLNLVGITITHGNAPLSSTLRNARQIVDFAGLGHIPVAAGLDRPLVRTPQYALEIHGTKGLGGIDLPEPTLALHELHAIDFIIAESHRHPQLILVPTGPLTNIAAALLRDPSLVNRVSEICLMGGSTGIGNTTAAAEFNVYADPEAAHIVFTSGIPIRMVGLNVTRQVPATPDRRAQVRALGSPVAIMAADLLDFFSLQVQRIFNLPGGAMHDPLAVAVLLDPEVVTFQRMHVAIELRGEHTYGMTICDNRYIHMSEQEQAESSVKRGGPANALVATAVNQDRFWEIFLAALSKY